MRVGVIGSGISGISAVRELSRALPGGEVCWFSEDKQAGGLWCAARADTRLYDSLFLNTSLSRSLFTGVPLPAAAPVRFIHHAPYGQYLADVADDLVAERRWNNRVTSVAAGADGRWRVRWEPAGGGEEHEAFDAVVDATGHNGLPRWPEVPVADGLAYDFHHSAAYRNATPYRAKRVLIVGGGASAVDIACDLVPVAAEVGVSIRSPNWYLPKMLLGRPLDQSSDGWWQHLPGIKPVFTRVAEAVVRRVVGHYPSYGLPEPITRLATATPVLSDHFLAHLSHGRLDLRGPVVALDDKVVRFADGTQDAFDAVIAATGFSDDPRHLPPDVRRVLSGRRLGLSLEVAPFAGLYLMNRFRCGDAAVRCAEVQADAIARSLIRRANGAAPAIPRLSAGAARITARTLRTAYRNYS